MTPICFFFGGVGVSHPDDAHGNNHIYICQGIRPRLQGKLQPPTPTSPCSLLFYLLVCSPRCMGESTASPSGYVPASWHPTKLGERQPELDCPPLPFPLPPASGHRGKSGTCWWKCDLVLGFISPPAVRAPPMAPHILTASLCIIASRSVLAAEAPFHPSY